MTGIWLVLAALLVLAAAMTGDFTLLALAVSALAGAAAATLTDFGALTQLGIVAVTAAVLGPVLNRVLRPLLRGPDYGVTGAEAGMQAQVVRSGERIGVELRHDFFPARTEAGDVPTEGHRVTVLRFEGITAIVEPLGSSPPSATD